MPETQKRNVFVVDDEQLIAYTLAVILKMSGYASLAFTDPLEALKTSESLTPELLITDVMMPQLNGIELAIKIKAKCPECKVLLFSGTAATADLLNRARNDGHDFGLPGFFCTRLNETNWYERSLEWHEERSIVRSRS
jgi:CheY-like chemotaxis protein